MVHISFWSRRSRREFQDDGSEDFSKFIVCTVRSVVISHYSTPKLSLDVSLVLVPRRRQLKITRDCNNLDIPKKIRIHFVLPKRLIAPCIFTLQSLEAPHLCNSFLTMPIIYIEARTIRAVSHCNSRIRVLRSH